MNLPSTRKEAKECNSKYFFTGKPCNHGHISKRFTSSKGCVECQLERSRRPEEKERRKETSKRWAKENPERIKEIRHKSYHKDPARSLAHTNRWVEKNRHKVNAYAASRRSKIASFPLSSIEKMMVENIYEDCQRISKETGIPHQVDHIIPISKGGPHHPWNLRIITAEENLRKSNKL